VGDEELIDRTEGWFLRRGIPHFIDDYRADEDVFTRALPFLVLVGIVELVGSVEQDWDWWGNVAAIAAALATVVGLWALLNRMRGRPAWQRPETVGNVEIAFFVLVLPFARWSAESTLSSVGLTFAFNLTLVVVVYLVTSYGLLPMARWAFGRTLDQLGAVAGLFGRAMPLLLLFSIALFVNTEVWQVASSLDGLLFWSTVAFFVLVGTVFLLVRLPGEVARLGDAQDRAAVVDATCGTPMEGVVDGRLGPGEVPPAVPLTKRQKGNVLLVLLFSQAIQILLVTVSLSLFFFAFGLVAIRPEVIDAWLGDVVDPGHLAEFRWFGQELVVTRALVHVAGFLGILAGFYFTVYVITDSTYREEFFEEIVDQVRQSLAVRRVYLALIGLDRAEADAG
jgi:hypothetical protein